MRISNLDLKRSCVREKIPEFRKKENITGDKSSKASPGCKPLPYLYYTHTKKVHPLTTPRDEPGVQHVCLHARMISNLAKGHGRR